MITKKTFPTIIVPIIAPTWMYDARAEKSSPAPQADTQMNAKTSTARMPSSFGNVRHSPS